jgi:hypothetical protein
MKTAARIGFILGCLVVASALLLPARVEAKVASIWPLAEGNFWVYQNTRFGGETRWEVTCRELGVACLDVGFDTYRLQDLGNGTNIELGDEGFVLFYDFTADSAFVHRDPFTCNDGVRVTVTFETEDIVTPAGTFPGCLRLDFDGSLCSDAGTFAEWWAPGIGMVRRLEDNITGALTLDLVDYRARQVGPSGFFRRADANSDGNVDISDPVSVLRWLGLGAAAPPCLKAADSNDDGQIDLSDPIWTLSYLFLGGRPPPTPFAECGFDPTDDSLSCDEFTACS